VRPQACQPDLTRLASHRLENTLPRRGRALEPVLAEGEVELMQECRLDRPVVRRRDIGSRDGPAQISAHKLEEVRVAARRLDDLADQRQRERPAAASQRDAEGVPRVAPLEVAQDDVTEHALGVRAGPLEVESQGRQTGQDDADAGRLSLG
jgi:hypothetical protein